MDEQLIESIKQKMGFRKRVVYCRDCAHAVIDGEKISCALCKTLAVFPVYRVSSCYHGFDKNRLASEPQPSDQQLEIAGCEPKVSGR